jgi:hypothetical protein
MRMDACLVADAVASADGAPETEAIVSDTWLVGGARGSLLPV